MRDLLNALYALHPLASGAAEVAVIALAAYPLVMASPLRRMVM
jgi:hypothetical protein